jgi:alpha-1,4-digalacturonate transport system substrate-binding protein
MVNQGGTTVTKLNLAATTAAATGLALMAGAASAQEIRFMCYSDGNECEVYDDVLEPLRGRNEGIDVVVDVVPYQAILENLPVQLAAGTGPDIAKVTDLGGLNEYYLDLTPYVDTAYWEASFGGTLDWYRGGPDRSGHLRHAQPADHHRRLRERHALRAGGHRDAGRGCDLGRLGRSLPRRGRGHRHALPDGDRPLRPPRRGSRDLLRCGSSVRPRRQRRRCRRRLQRLRGAVRGWHEDGTIARDVWAGQGGATYQDAAQEFINGELVFYYSGSWQVGRMDEQVGDFFDWQVVGSPCGPAGACSGMPGGAGIVGFEQTENPEAVAAVIDFLAQEDIYAEVTARTRNLPGHLGVASAGVEFQDASPGRIRRAGGLRRRPARRGAGGLRLPGLCRQPRDVRHHRGTREPGHRGRADRRGSRRPHGRRPRRGDGRAKRTIRPPRRRGGRA